MAIKIYTYHNPYSLTHEDYWNEISNCPYFCVSQTLVNGLKKCFSNKYFPSKRITTVNRLVDSIYEKWTGAKQIIKQHTDIDNYINQKILSNSENQEVLNVYHAFLHDREDVFDSIRTMSELSIDPSTLPREKLNIEQKIFIDMYSEILKSDYKEDFILEDNMLEDEINQRVKDALNKNPDKNVDISSLNLNTIVIHGVHQFTPIMLKTIELISKYKTVILLFNYQAQYKNVYQTWLDIYSAFDRQICDSTEKEFLVSDPKLPSYDSNTLADKMGRLVEGRRNSLAVSKPYEIIEFDNTTEFATYVAQIFERAAKTNPTQPMVDMEEQIYAADSSVNNILKIYFPEQFGERKFLDYPIGHFFIAIANMWNPDTNTINIKDLSDIRECLTSKVIKEDIPGELISYFSVLEPVFMDCATIQDMCKRIKRIIKVKKRNRKEKLEHIAYYRLSEDQLNILSNGLLSLEETAELFYKDFERNPDNFRKFYKKMKGFLKTNILEREELSEEFRDILERVLERLNNVEDIQASASFECLKSTMSIYLQQEKAFGKSANWIVRNFEQIDGDILRSKKESDNKIYHFACLSDEDITASNVREFTWPLDANFFEVAYQPLDWKAQVYIKSRKEYKNFKRYALIFGLEFNRAKYKLSYVRRVGDHQKEPYYLLEMLGIKPIRYIEQRRNPYLADSSAIQIQGREYGEFNQYDYFRYRMCGYRFLLESLVENSTTYKDRFLLLKYFEIILENKLREEMQNMPVIPAVLSDKIDDEYNSLYRYFPFSKAIDYVDIKNNVNRRMSGSKDKTFPTLADKDKEYLRIRELFIYKKLSGEKGKNLLSDVFQDASDETIQKVLSEPKFTHKCNEWCKYCADREICIAYNKNN